MSQGPHPVKIEWNYKSPSELDEEERAKRSIAERKRNWNWDGQFLCKVCKHVHPFALYGDDSRSRSEFFTFSEDFSTVRVPCIGEIAETGPLYKYEEMIMPSHSKSEAKLTEFERRLLRLEEIVGKGDMQKGEKSLRDRLTEAEDIIGKIAETALAEKTKPPPKGQHA